MKTFLRGAFGLEVISKWEPNCWIKIDCPDTEDYNYLQKTLNVPEYFLSDIADIDERPRVETEDEWTFIILRIPHRQDDSKMPFITVPLGIIFKDNICISICHYQTVMLKDFLTYYERKNLGFTDTVDLIFKLFLSSSVWYLKSLKIINQRIDVVKRELERSIENKELLALFHLENCLTYFITSLKGNEILLSKLKFKLPVDELDVELIEDVEIELKQAHESANIYSNILSGMMDAYSSIISNNVNSIMITSYIIYPLEVVSPGWLNFKNIVLLYTPVGALYVIWLITLWCGVNYSDFSSLQEMLPYITEFNVWFRFILCLLILCPVFFIFFVPYTKKYCNVDNRWKWIYMVDTQQSTTDGNFTITLDRTKTYYALLWADNNASAIYDITSLKAVKLKTGQLPAEAFYGRLTIAGNQANYDVSLKRAVAKVNLNETGNLPKGSVTVKYNQQPAFNVVDGTTSGIAANLTATVTTTADFTGTKTVPVTLNTDQPIYVLASNTAGNVDFTLQYKDATEISAETEFTVTAPVQANYNTNIKGHFTTVVPIAKVGDFYYKNGTWHSVRSPCCYITLSA